MTPPEVEVDAELAARAAEIAAARGESLEEVIARALQRYVISSLDE
jgi:predicted HicB family RNase H-like nuclease